MSRAEAFEHYWTEAERPGRPRSETVPPPAEVAGLVATATLLRDHAEAIPAMDLDQAWESLTIRLAGVAPGSADSSSGHHGPSVPDPRLNGSRIGPGNVAVLRPRLGGWSIRVAAAAVAAMIALATVSLRAMPGSALYPVRLTAESVALAVSPNDGALHIRIAEARLDDLLVALRRGPAQAAPGLARSLMANRAAAVRQRLDVSDLDLRVALDVPLALGGAPSSIASAVRRILGSLLPGKPTEGRAGPPPPELPSKDAPGASKGPGGGDDQDPEEDQPDQKGPRDHDEREEPDEDRDRQDEESERERSKHDEGSGGDHEPED